MILSFVLAAQTLLGVVLFRSSTRKARIDMRWWKT
jgi:hypothetical protein